MLDRALVEVCGWGGPTFDASLASLLLLRSAASGDGDGDVVRTVAEGRRLACVRAAITSESAAAVRFVLESVVLDDDVVKAVTPDGVTALMLAAKVPPSESESASDSIFSLVFSEIGVKTTSRVPANAQLRALAAYDCSKHTTAWHAAHSYRLHNLAHLTEKVSFFSSSEIDADLCKAALDTVRAAYVWLADCPFDDGRIPLADAIVEELSAVVAGLLIVGADPLTETWFDGKCYTCRELAVLLGCSEVVKLFRVHESE